LFSIAEGLEEIHRQNLIHRDFHSGNILKDGSWLFKITDLGLCRPASETNETKIYGILPYIAPEILKELFKNESLRKIGYTQASDVYSWGMVAYEVLSGKPPYYEFAYDETLALKIMKGFRPNLEETLAAQLLKDLIKRCWDIDPKKRPTTREIEKNLWVWWRWSYCKKDPEFCQQLEKIERVEDLNELSPMEIKDSTYKNHPQVIYTSRLLDFSKSQNNPFQEWQTTTLLELQINSAEKEIELLKESLNNNELIELVEEFIELSKKLKRDKSDERARRRLNELDEKLLEEEILSEEEIDKIALYCEKLFELERKSIEQFQGQIEIPLK
jgi:serine/threonine protein kinase